MLYDRCVKAYMDGQLLSYDGRASVLVYVSFAIQVHDYHRQVALDGLLDFPTHELAKITRVFAHQENEEF